MAAEKIYNLENRKTYIINAERRGENSMSCPVCSGDRKKKNVKCMSFNTIEGVGHCNHCNARFVRKSEEQEQQRYARPVAQSNPTALPDKIVAWFKDRGISSSTLIDFNVESGKMFFPQVAQERNCILFNYYRDGELINIKYRDAEKNFRLVKDAELVFYNLDSIKDDYVIITEGECFHPSAEVLTQYGWVRFDEFEALENPMVAQYKDSGDIEYVKPIAFINKHFEGSLIEIKNKQRFYSLTTPEHNMVYVDPYGIVSKKKHYEASARYSIPRTAKHNGNGIELSDDEIKLCIAVSADFTIREKGDIYGAFKKQRKVERITEILNRLGIEYSSNPAKGDYTSFFIRRGNAPKYLFKKFPSNWIFESTQHQKDLIISEILHWDGNLVPERNQIEYSSKDYDNATFIQTISHLCGYCSTIMSRSNEFGSWYKVSILFGKQTTSNQSLKRGTLEVEYKGIVNCVQVPSGMILVRQNGCISISGNCDAMAYHEVGITSVVSVPNGASKNNRLQYVDNCIDRFDNVKIIYLATDDDEPGRILQEELARRFGKDRCRKISFFGKKDANELLLEDRLALPETLEAAEEYPLEGIVTIDGIADDIWRLRREGLKPGCDISIDAFNELLTFVPGYVTGVTGIPNHGKSEFLDQIMVDLSVRHGWRFGIFSPENYPLQLHFSKVASKLVGTAFNDMGDREIIAAMNYCRDNFFYIAPEEDNSLDSIIEHAKSLVKKYGINAIIIDAWNKLDHTYQTSETQHISKELDKLIDFCRKNSVHAFVVAHPTKMSRDPKTQQYNVATLYDMSGSAHFYNKCDNGISVYRHFFEDGGSMPEIFVQKVKFKHWGRQGSRELQYDVPSGRYYIVGKLNKTSYLSTEFNQQEFEL